MPGLISYFPNINRTALIIKPKKPFYDWLKKIDSKDRAQKDMDFDVYLLDDFEMIEEMEDWLKDNYDDFFCDQMNNWYTDENLWISARTFDLFKKWFEYSLHTMVWDTKNKPIKKFN